MLCDTAKLGGRKKGRSGGRRVTEHEEGNTPFLGPVKTDATFELEFSVEETKRIKADAASHGKADFELTGEVKDAEGKVVAKTHGLYQLRSLGT